MVVITKPSGRKRANVDRLSSLPDDILIHILAFLPTKTYVATSILGRRWRFLWASVPNLDFNDENFDNNDTGANSFSSIVNRVMFLHKRAKINSFNFRQYRITKHSDYEYEKWINTAIEYKVQKLNLSLGCALTPPSCIFNCKTLVDLSLSWLHMPTIDNTVYLPVLKKLRLGMVFFGSVECFHHLLSGCPLLNELFINKPSGFNEFCISSPTLNRLQLEIDHYVKPFTSFSGKELGLKLDTPALKYLKFNNYKLVPRFAFSASAETWHNLIDIELEADWRFIKVLLEKADNLRVLTIRCDYGGKNPTHWVNPKQVSACLVSRLRTLRICGFKCTEQEFNVVRYILENAKVLKRMEIDSRHNMKKQLVALKRISRFKRGSDACRLVFH